MSLPKYLIGLNIFTRSHQIIEIGLSYYRFSLYFAMSHPGIHWVELMQFLVIMCLCRGLCSLSALVDT